MASPSIITMNTTGSTPRRSASSPGAPRRFARAGNSNYPFKYSNRSASTPNFKIDTQGNVDLNGNDISNVGSLNTEQLSSTTTDTEELHHIVTVGSSGKYSSVKAAMDDITDGAADNRYLLWLLSDTSEPGEVSAKSHIDVWLNGHEIVLDSDSSGTAVVLDSVTDVRWYDGTIRRKGKAPSGSRAVALNATSDDTVLLDNVRAINDTTANVACDGFVIRGDVAAKLRDCVGEGGSGGDNCQGIKIRSSAVPTLRDVTGRGGGNGAECTGIWIQDTAAPDLSDCVGEGGSGGDKCFGVVIRVESTPTLDDVTGVGGDGGDICHGIDNRHKSAATLTGCVGKGGDGGRDCRGINSGDSATPEIDGCVGRGGDGGNECPGVHVGGASAPSLSGVVGLSGEEGTSCYGFEITGNAAPDLSGCTGTYKTNPEIYYYDGTTNDSFSPTSNHPWMLDTLGVQVTAAGAAGATLDIGTTQGGSEIAADVPIDTAYSEQYFDFSRVSRAPTESIHLTPSDTSAELDIVYSWATNYGSRNGLYLNTTSYATVSESTFIGTRSSDGGVIGDRALGANNYEVTLCTLRATDPSSNAALSGASPSSDDPIKLCAFDGGISNLKPQQDPLRTPHSSTSPTYAIGDGWRQASADRPALVVADAIAETDGSVSAHVTLKVDESGGTTADYSSTLAYADVNENAGTVDQGSMATVYLPPGAQYLIAETEDPNNTNAIQTHQEFIL